MIVIVSGPPGAGKTTVARSLAERSERGVHLVSDEFYRWIVTGFVAPQLPDAQVQNEVVLDVALSAVTAYASGGYDVFWDGVIGPWWLDQIIDGLEEQASDAHYLILRPSRAIALDRVARRDGTTDVSGAEIMHDQFRDLGAHERHVIVSDDAPEQVEARCSAALEAGTHVLATPRNAAR